MFNAQLLQLNRIATIYQGTTIYKENSVSFAIKSPSLHNKNVQNVHSL